MGPTTANRRHINTRIATKLGMAALLFFFAAVLCLAQDIPIGAPFVCNGEHIYIEGCNIRDTSDTSTCMVAHPDHLTPSGLNTYTSMTRADLKKLLPTCKQPTPQQLAAAQAFQKKQHDLYNANVEKTNEQMKAATQPAAYGQPVKPKTPEERQMARCITSGRLPASCTGNSLMGAFTQMIGQVLPSVAKEPPPGPKMAGVFQGAGNWRIDFLDQGVLVNCSSLAPDQHNYTLDFKGEHPTIIIDTTPKPLVLTMRPDGTIVGPGPFTINGVVVSGYTNPTSSYGTVYKDAYGNKYDSLGNRIYGDPNNIPGHATFSPKTATCPALNLSSKGAGVGVETMQTDMLKTMFGGDKGPPTPPGIRMQGIFAASTGFSVQFFPESVILGCGPDAARAYPYTVTAGGGRALIEVAASDHPLKLAMKPDGSLDPGATGPYQVHGRVVTGQDANDDFTFAPFEQTCNLAVLTPSKTIPMSGGTAGTITASASGSAAPSNGGGTLSTPAAPLGNAALAIVSGFPTQQGSPNPLAGHPYVLLRNSYAEVLAQAGVTVPAGMSPYKYVGMACGNRTPDCPKIMDAIKANAASAARADANGSATFPGVPPGTYYLMISTRFNNQALVWGQAVQLKPGQNSMTLNPGNATPVN